MKNNQLDALIEEVDSLIRSARTAKAQTILKPIKRGEIPPDRLYEIAALLRRASLFADAVFLLRPLIRPVKLILRESREVERAEYAASLLRLGATQEASTLLDSVSPDSLPEVLMYKAIIRLQEWNYNEAALLLRKYLKKPLTPYQALIGKMNLALCLLFEGPFDEAEKLLKELLAATEEKGDLLLVRGNALRLWGNLELNRNRLQAALGYFHESETLLCNVGGLAHFFSRKWMAIAEYLIKPSHTDGLNAIQSEALKLGHWETVRDLDYHRLLVNLDPELFQRLYFGSPQEQFRKRLLRKFPSLSVPETYYLTLGEGTKKTPPKVHPVNEDLKPGQAMHRLYFTLLSDFYQPFSVYVLFEKLFPSEFYTPLSSEQRVHQSIKRLRTWFKVNNLPLAVTNVKTAYRISATKPCRLYIEQAAKPISLAASRLESLREKCPTTFSASDAAKALKLSRRTASDLLNSGISEKVLERVGAATATKYRFLK